MDTSSPTSRSGPDPRPARRLATVNRALRGLARRAWFLEEEVRGVRDLVPTGGTCIDVGAEYGLYTVAMAAAVGPTGTVHAVEPQPGPNRWITRLVTALGAAGTVHVHDTALGATPQRSWMSVPQRRGLPVHGRAYVTAEAVDGGLNDAEFGRERRIPVEVTTLDELCERADVDRIDLIKADVEGAEAMVLQGGVERLRRHRPAVQLEIFAPHLAKYDVTVDDLVGTLAELGYAPHVWADDGWVPTDVVDGQRYNYLFLT